jgi:hypothetical protein
VKFKLTVAAMVAALLIALPFEVAFTKYEWRFDPANYPKMVQWAGCTAELDVDENDSPAGSYYVPGYHVLHIGAKDDPAIPYYAGLMILLHETGHCLQFQANPEEHVRNYRANPVKYELDADRRSADLACGLGLDGRTLLRQTFQWAHDSFGYNGDDQHGTLVERMSQGDNARACDKKIESWASISFA